MNNQITREELEQEIGSVFDTLIDVAVEARMQWKSDNKESKRLGLGGGGFSKYQETLRKAHKSALGITSDLIDQYTAERERLAKIDEIEKNTGLDEMHSDVGDLRDTVDAEREAIKKGKL